MEARHPLLWLSAELIKEETTEPIEACTMSKRVVQTKLTCHKLHGSQNLGVWAHCDELVLQTLA